MFVVKGINQTFINNEFIIPKKAADKLIGLDELVENEYQTLNNIDLEKYKFNGILSKNKLLCNYYEVQDCILFLVIQVQ
ncbi:hypothetical protein NW731_02785 [Mycoplasmopsis felis]|uniref:hypothetical protein n=1 Tax=Mycoplasmopsis felis TaxID=33923 RepID=UPI0021DFA673|nr:hypothetical protein [Mycoplasmopsis felis]MCU9937395.1 hypothetical protein [Mycoplasmopsis felis]